MDRIDKAEGKYTFKTSKEGNSWEAQIEEIKSGDRYTRSFYYLKDAEFFLERFEEVSKNSDICDFFNKLEELYEGGLLDRTYKEEREVLKIEED